MKREVGWVLLFAGAFAAAAADRPKAAFHPGGLETRIDRLPRHAVDVGRLVEAVARECRLEVAVDPAVAGEVSVERLPATARSILDAVLLPRGALYLVEDGVLRVMPEDAMRRYFRDRAVFRSFAGPLDPEMVRRLLETPDLVSTMGSLGFDPHAGLVCVRDLPSFADRVERILRPQRPGEVWITL